jgi:hypothetical protein
VIYGIWTDFGLFWISGVVGMHHCFTVWQGIECITSIVLTLYSVLQKFFKTHPIYFVHSIALKVGCPIIERRRSVLTNSKMGLRTLRVGEWVRITERVRFLYIEIEVRIPDRIESGIRAQIGQTISRTSTEGGIVDPIDISY